MSSLLILATTDDELAASWEQQLPADRPVARLGAACLTGATVPDLSAVVVLDAAAEKQLPATLARCPTIFVGEPRSLPYEQARLNQRARVYLSYRESATRLQDFIGLMEELAEKQSLVELLLERNRRHETARPARENAPAAEAMEWWDFLEGAIEALESRERLITEFRRASRQLLRASHAVFFLHGESGFQADQGTSVMALGDPIVAFLESHPAVIDAANWECPADPVAELAVRNRLALWGARLLVPIHDNGRLQGLMVLGVRDNGQPYGESDRARAVLLARLLRHFLARSTQLNRLMQMADRANQGAKYVPFTLLLGADEKVPRHVPLVVRELIEQVRRQREVCRASPAKGQPFRASAGPVVETNGVWASWEEASAEIHDALVRQRGERRTLIRELALTMSHELGNALVSLAAIQQMPAERITPDMREAFNGDIGRLLLLNQRLEMMQRLNEAEPVETDLRDLIRRVGAARHAAVETGPDPVRLRVAEPQLEFALGVLAETLLENQLGARESALTLQLRATGEGEDRTALVSFKGGYIELEGIMPVPLEGAVPNQGRLAVFLAKEIIRLHHGDIHAGPGVKGTEILISLKSC